MSESSTHRELVKALINWIIFNCLNGDGGAILSDTGGTTKTNLPPRIGVCVPDVYVADASLHSVVIGEAKTAHDLENKHSRKQIETFLAFCNKSPRSLFVMAVPWHRVAYTRNMLRLVIRKREFSSIQFTVIENLPG